MTETQPLSAPRRGDLTRERLLDAAEAWVAEAGFDAPTHRGIGERAHVHTALINYHFGSKEVLLEDMVERRAARLIGAWRDALAYAREQGDRGPESVFAAYWEPFRAMRDEPQPWRGYLCVVAFLFHDRGRASSRARYFGAIDREFHDALRVAVPSLGDTDIQRAYQYGRTLLDEALYFRCVMAGEAAAPIGFRDGEMPALFRFLASGIQALPDAPAAGGGASSLHAVAE